MRKRRKRRKCREELGQGESEADAHTFERARADEMRGMGKKGAKTGGRRQISKRDSRVITGLEGLKC